MTDLFCLYFTLYLSTAEAEMSPFSHDYENAYTRLCTNKPAKGDPGRDVDQSVPDAAGQSGTVHIETLYR